MSEEKQNATSVAQKEQAVPASTEQETTKNSTDVGSLIAESKKYRSRARKSEEQVTELQKQLESIETEKLKAKEEWQSLFEKRDAEAKEMEKIVNHAKNLDATLREDALTSLTEEDREFAEDLSTEKLLKFAKRTKTVVMTDESVAHKVAAGAKHPFKDMDKRERSSNWKKVMDYYNKN